MAWVVFEEYRGDLQGGILGQTRVGPQGLTRPEGPFSPWPWLLG